MSDVIIEKKNEVYIKLQCEPHILYELQPYFTFEVESAKFSPAYRKKYWDGKIYLLSVQTGEVYAGLIDKVIEKLKAHNYTYSFKYNKFYGSPFETNEFISLDGVKDYMNSICSHSPREYQIEGVYDALKNNRKVLLSPTGSGKSLMIYTIVRYYADKGEKVLIIVPTTSLVSQLYKDFEEYGWDAESYCHKIFAGEEKKTNLPVTISTWQSIYKLDKSYFDDYTSILGDECLSPDTLIKIEDGTEKEIKNIQVGDNVLTFNEKTGEIESKPVLKIHKNISPDEKMYKITLSNGRSIKITGNHKVLLKNGTWIRSDQIKSGDIINSIE